VARENPTMDDGRRARSRARSSDGADATRATTRA